MSYNSEAPSGQYNTGVSQLKITDLNIDCLLNLFRYLDVSDLGRASYVCQLFQEIAVEAFKFEWKDKTIRLCNDSKKGRLETATTLRQFGSMLQKVIVVFGERSNDIFFNIVMEKCTLNVTDVEFSGSSFSDQLEKVLNKGNICRFFDKLKNVKNLRFGSNADELIDSQCIEQPFPALEQLSLFGYPFKNRNVEHFVTLNPQVKSIHLRLCNDVESSRNITEVISQKLPQLEQLGLWVHGNANEIQYQPLFFNNLKRLNIQNYGSANNVQHLSISNKTVEQMEFEVNTCDEQLINVISQYKEVKKLAISTYMDSPFDAKLLQKLGNNLSKLTEIKITSFYENLDYADIVNFVCGTKELVKFIMRDSSRSNILGDTKELQCKFNAAEWNVACCQSNSEISISKVVNTNTRY